MAQAQTSPWAGVPYNPDVTQAQAIPWAVPMPTDDIEPSSELIPQQQMETPKLDLHAHLPPVFAPTPKPNPQDEITGHLQGSLERDYEKDANPWGSPNNHPGVFGKIAHALSHATGGDTRRGWEEQGLAKELNDVVGQKSANDYRGAETAKTLEDTAEAPQRASDTHAQSDATTENLKSETNARDNPPPNLAAAYAHAVMTNQPPEVIQHIADAIQEIQKPPAEQGVGKTTDLKGPDGKVHTMGYDAKTQKYDIDEGESGFKPAVTNVNSGDTALDREATRLGKPYEKGVSDANSQLEKIADARTMVNGNAEAQALGIPKVLTALVSGQGSGVRITQPELNAIAKARGLSGDLEGTLNSWSGKGKLTSTQQQQLTAILNDVQQRILEKQAIHNDALDKINGASTRQQVIEADKEARQKLNEVENSGKAETQSGQPENEANRVKSLKDAPIGSLAGGGKWIKKMNTGNPSVDFVPNQK